MKNKSVVERICNELAKKTIKGGIITAKKLIISPDVYGEYIKWDCQNQCLYYPSFVNPPDIMGLKVEVRAGNNLLKVL